MKPPKKPKKITKKKLIAQLEKRASELWKQHARLRDGKRCMMAYWYPQFNRKHSLVFQTDHCFSRGVKALFFETSNSTVICSGCNRAKDYGSEQVKIGIQRIVRKREGEEKFNEMEQIAFLGGSFELWKTVPWLEQKVKELEEAIAKLGSGENNGKLA